jgi:hypothetical protein
MGEHAKLRPICVRLYTYHDRSSVLITLPLEGLVGVILRSVLVIQQIAYLGNEWIGFSVRMGDA